MIPTATRMRHLNLPVHFATPFDCYPWPRLIGVPPLDRDASLLKSWGNRRQMFCLPVSLGLRGGQSLVLLGQGNGLCTAPRGDRRGSLKSGQVLRLYIDASSHTESGQGADIEVTSGAPNPINIRNLTRLAPGLLPALRVSSASGPKETSG